MQSQLRGWKDAVGMLFFETWLKTPPANAQQGAVNGPITSHLVSLASERKIRSAPFHSQSWLIPLRDKMPEYGHKGGYQPLDIEQKEIRLIELLSYPKSGTVRCKLHTVSLNTKPYFIALSYPCGPSWMTEEIQVNRQSVRVPKNLEVALRHSKRHWVAMSGKGIDTSSIRLWADAICIDQTNAAERSSQVQLMKDIYTSADSVFTWLSPRDDCLGALQLLEELSGGIEAYYENNCGPFPDLDSPDCTSKQTKVNKCGWIPILDPDIEDPDCIGNPEVDDQVEWYDMGYWINYYKGKILDGDEKWEEFSILFKLPVWSRLWIQQEMILAPKLYFLTPSLCISYGKFAMAFQWLQKLLRHEEVTEAIQEENPRAAAKLNRIRNFLSPMTFTLSLRKIFRVPPFPETGPMQQMAALTILCHEIFEATDPRDYVYGLLGLTGLDIIPDYTKPEGEVFVEFATKWLETWQSLSPSIPTFRRLGCLAFLHVFGAGIQAKQTMPTWAPAFSIHRDQRAKSTKLSEDNRLYSKVPGLRDQHVKVVGNSLWVAAVTAQKVTSRYKHPISEDFVALKLGACLKHFLKSHGAIYCNGQPLLKVLASTFLSTEHRYYDLGDLFHLLAKTGQLSHRLEEQLEKDGLELSGEIPGQGFIKEGWGMVGEHHKRGVLISTADGYIGMAGVDVQEGDFVSILTGCNSPVVLRPVGGHYLYVGCCFMPGLMDGEVAGLVDSGDANVELIEIR